MTRLLALRFLLTSCLHFRWHGIARLFGSRRDAPAEEQRRITETNAWINSPGLRPPE